MRGLLVALAALALAGPAAAKPDPQLVTLRHQVATLSQQVTRLQTAVTVLHNRDECYYALQQDVDRTVFGALNQFAKYLTGATVPAWDTYLALPRYDDKGSCVAAGITRP